MKKDYILDDKKVRKCDSNISKMNVAEYMYYDIFHWNYLGGLLTGYILGNLIEIIKYFGAFLVNTIIFLLTPLILPIIAYISIKKAKKECLDYNPKGVKVDKEDFISKLKPRS